MERDNSDDRWAALIDASNIGTSELTQAFARYIGSFQEENRRWLEENATRIDSIRADLIRDALAAVREHIAAVQRFRDLLLDEALRATDLSNRELSRQSGVNHVRIAKMRADHEG